MAGAVALGVSAQVRSTAAPVLGADLNHPYMVTATQPAYYAPQPAYASEMVSMPVQRARTVARPVAARQRVVAREVEDRRDGRSWGKTAMIIGGSAGGGAGIGGLIGGKKGALIGAAIGGGAATIYESTKR